MLAFSPAAVAAEPAVRLDPAAGVVEAVDLPAAVLGHLGRLTDDDWRAIFPVYTGSQLPTDAGKPPVAGTWVLEDRVVKFRPRFPLVAGLDYVARLDVGRLVSLATGRESRRAPVVASFSLPPVAREPTTLVSQVYPTADRLPENLLRFYIHFSAPMGRGEAYEHIRLLDTEGRRVDGVFLEIREELWDPGMRRLTVFFDPGRIKRGLRPHLEVGTPLSAGAGYRLLVDPHWRDAAGQPLAAGFEKAFTVHAADRESPDPADWQIVAPTAGGRQALEIRFPEPLDHGLLRRVVQVRDAKGERLAGEVEITDQERLFRFTPHQPWPAAEYAIQVETVLEDLAGNNLKKVFDLDLAAPPRPATEDRETISLPFTVAGR